MKIQENEYNKKIYVVKDHKYSSDFLKAYLILGDGVSCISKDRLIVPGLL